MNLLQGNFFYFDRSCARRSCWHLYFQACKLLAKGMKQRDTLILFGILILLSFCMGHACVNVHAFWTEPVILWVACAITGIYICLNSTSFFFLNSFSFYYPTKNPLFLSCLLKIVGCLNQSFSVLYFCFLFSLSVMTTNRHTIMIVKREVLTFKRKLLWMQKRIPTSYSVHFIFWVYFFHF